LGKFFDMIRMVIFDMAGTTIDEDNLVYKCIRKALEIHGFPVELHMVLYHCAGKEKKDAIQKMLSLVSSVENDDENVNAIYTTFSELLDEAYAIAPIGLMEGTRAVIYYLKRNGIKIVFNTGYSHEIALRLLEKVNCLPGNDIDALITADMVAYPRPAPDMIQKALLQFQIDPKQCLKVGDSIIDIEEGQNAGVGYTIGVTTGAQRREQLQTANPDDILDDIVDLIPLIQRINYGRLA